MHHNPRRLKDPMNRNIIKQKKNMEELSEQQFRKKVIEIITKQEQEISNLKDEVNNLEIDLTSLQDELADTKLKQRLGW